MPTKALRFELVDLFAGIGGFVRVIDDDVLPGFPTCVDDFEARPSPRVVVPRHRSRVPTWPARAVDTASFSFGGTRE
jgi:hypothetical protein